MPYPSRWSRVQAISSRLEFRLTVSNDTSLRRISTVESAGRRDMPGLPEIGVDPDGVRIVLPLLDRLVVGELGQLAQPDPTVEDHDGVAATEILARPAGDRTDTGLGDVVLQED